MTDITNADALIHGTSYDEVDEIWNDEITDATVIELSTKTQIKYTFLDGVPLYYSDNSEPESATGAFDPISSTSNLGNAIKLILGEASASSGFEGFYAEVAHIDFTNKDQPSSTSNDVGAITFAQYDPAVQAMIDDGRDDASGYVNELAWDTGLSDSRLVGDVWLNKDQITENGNNLNPGDSRFAVLLHEIGHALGLEHPNAVEGEIAPHLTGNELSVKYTTMIVADTDDDQGGPDDLLYEHPDMYYDTWAIPDSNYQYVRSLQLYDIAAIQSIYGRNYDTRATGAEKDTTYTFGTDEAFGETKDDAFLYTIWDGDGDDTIDADGYDNRVQIDLRQGRFSSIGENGNGSQIQGDIVGSYDAGNLAIAFHTVIENAIGTDHHDILVGNAWDNTLEGGAGNDILYGDGLEYDNDSGFGTGAGEWDTNNPDAGPASDNSGIDTLKGGAGNDTLFGGAGGDNLDGGADTDTASYAKDGAGIAVDMSAGTDGKVTDGYGDIDTLTSIEKIIGSARNDTFKGDEGDDHTFDGNNGVDIVDYSGYTSGVTVTISTTTRGSATVTDGSSGTTTLSNIERLIGTSSADTFNLGKGSITVEGGGGADVYVIDLGDDTQATILDSGGSDTLRITGAAAATDIKLVQQGDHLFVLDKSGGDKHILAMIPDHFTVTGEKVDTLEIKNSSGGLLESKTLTALTPSDLTKDYEDLFNAILTMWNNYGNTPNTPDPLFIDLDNDGISTDSVGDHHYFDFNADGFAEQTGWISPDDGFLVRDVNANGRIDNGSELFGDEDTDGFTALAAFDSNLDGVINASDTVWSDLRVWQDTNQDVQTQSTELLTLSSLNITGIDVLNVSPTSISNTAGTITHTGTVFTTSGTLAAGNYVFNATPINSVYAADYTLDLDAAGLPTVKGYGQVADLTIAMSIDNDQQDPDSLISIMQEIVSYDAAGLFENYTVVKGLVKDLMYRWAGVDAVAFDSRGPYISDARKLEFLEKYMGENFIDTDFNTDTPGTVQAMRLEDIFTEVWTRITSQIIVQASAGDLFAGARTYNSLTGKLEGSMTVSQSELDALETAATNLPGTDERKDFWVGVADYLNGLSMEDDGDSHIRFGLSSSDEIKLNDAIEASDPTLTWYEEDHGGGTEAIQYRYNSPLGDIITGTNSAETLNGGAEDDIIIGLQGADTINGNGGNDVLYGQNELGTSDDSAADTIDGGAGDDRIFGHRGDDVLTGGTGNDWIIGGNGDDTITDGDNDGQDLAEGGAGNDTYIAGTDAWFIDDTSGADDLKFSDRPVSGFDVNDIVFENVLGVGLRLTAAAGSGANFDVTIANQLDDLNNSTGIGIERVELSAGWLDLKDHLLNNFSGNFVANGTDFDDTIFGLNDVNDEINGGLGNDSLHGRTGNDELNGEGDDDILEGRGGDDTLDGGAGIDTATYENAAAGVNVTMTQSIDDGDGGDDTLISIENLTGSAFADTLTGDTGNNVLKGNAGDDTLYGGKGVDTLYGDDGADLLKGWDGNDTIYGGSGNDDIFGEDENDILYGGAGDDDIDGGSGTDTLFGQAGNDTLNGGSSADSLYGGAGNDTLDGVAGNDQLYGDDGNDTINAGNGTDTAYGGTGDDTLNGDGGNDTLYGEDGIDTLYGHTGRDFLYGGNGADILYGGGSDSKDDRFIFEDVTAFDAVDTVKDFIKGEDKLDISDILDGFYTDGVDVFADFVAISDDGTHTTIAVDQDGGADNFLDIVKVENTLWTDLADAKTDMLV